MSSSRYFWWYLHFLGPHLYPRIDPNFSLSYITHTYAVPYTPRRNWTWTLSCNDAVGATVLRPDLLRIVFFHAPMVPFMPSVMTHSYPHSVPSRTADDQDVPVRPQYGPDGLQVDELGNIFATAPSGVLIFSPDATPLGMIDPGTFTANVAMGRDGYLYMAARQSIMRIKVSTKALVWQ